MKTITRLLAVLALVGWTGAANAALKGYNFSYTLDIQSTLPGLEITGMLLGELQGDGNTVLVDSVSDLALDGVPFDPLFIDPTRNIVTIDGQTMNFCIATVQCAGLPEIFYIFASPGSTFVRGHHNSLGGITSMWFSLNWTLTPKIVPIPAASLIWLLQRLNQSHVTDE